MRYNEIKDQAESKWEAIQNSDKPRILIGMGTCGKAAGAADILESIIKTLEESKIHADIIHVGCIGLCYAEPMIEVYKPGMPSILYGNLDPISTSKIIKDYLKNGYPDTDFALGTRGNGFIEDIPRLFDLPVFKPQIRISLRNCGNIDPDNIDHYIANRGYEGLHNALNITPQGVIDEIKKSGLRGRGGAGFPTGNKWQFCHDSPGDLKYIVCNADEGDPGAFMDRALLEGDPHAVLEGMLIGAYAIGATEGYIYIRAEYPQAITRLQTAIKQMEDYNLIGNNILDSGFDFHVKIKKGAGAFVCGEETSLIASIEGKRGMPRPRPPFPAQSGLWGKPTNINNVETWANVSAILGKGADWFAGFGTEKSRGTKNFSLAGKIVRTGLIEVPLGITLREIIFEIGGGIPNGKRFKAVQTGGPSGGCLPARLLDIPVDYDSLAEAGSIMGSGGMVVMDEDTCMVDSAKYFLSFTQLESCGKCIPCRWGNKQLLDILEDITNGRGRQGDIELLLELSEGIKAGSLCGLGQTSPNPVLSTIRYFRSEYESHINKLHCSAAICKGLLKAPCSHTCPAGVDVPRYIRFIADKKYDDAVAVVRESIPFPSVCGYVCFHPCEAKCRRGLIDEPIAIKELKRFAADHAKNRFPDKKDIAKPTDKRVAVVGSGPAGLSAAYYLRKVFGHSITVFEELPEPGGMLRVGIPRYRLPKDVLDAEIDMIRKIGVTIELNTRVDSIDTLLEEYNAVFLATGAHNGSKMKVEGEDIPEVIDCVKLLRDVSLGKRVDLGKRVGVIGGGNAAIDAARTAYRLGADDVTILYRRTLEEMPASKEEYEEALNEGVKIEFLVTPYKIYKHNGFVQMDLMKMNLGRYDESGRRRPEPVPDSKFTLDFDNIVSAIGQNPLISENMKPLLDDRGLICADPYTLETDIQGVFAGGDVMSGPASVIEAIASGKQAAISIDKYLGGEGIIDEKFARPEKKIELSQLEEEEKYRPIMRKLSIKKRLKGFKAVDKGFTKSQATFEAKRCLKCDLEEY